jgi:hypothetical protein
MMRERRKYDLVLVHMMSYIIQTIDTDTACAPLTLVFCSDPRRVAPFAIVGKWLLGVRVSLQKLISRYSKGLPKVIHKDWYNKWFLHVAV